MPKELEKKPVKKRPWKEIIAGLLVLLGVEAGSLEILGKTFPVLSVALSSPGILARQLQTMVMAENTDIKEKDWTIEDEDACEVCKELADNGPYPVDTIIPEPHKNCRCWWEPHVE